MDNDLPAGGAGLTRGGGFTAASGDNLPAPKASPPLCRWLSNGDVALQAMLDAIGSARRSAGLEMYIFRGDPCGRRFRDALLCARKRGVAARVLIDGYGSMGLPGDFWSEFTRAGGEVRWFNALRLGRIAARDHRKLLVCDDELAIIGGFNIGEEYAGDGVTRGWFDLGLQVRGTMAAQAAGAFEEMFRLSGENHAALPHLRKFRRHRWSVGPGGALLLSAPGRDHSPLKAALVADLQKGRSVQIISAYFLPTVRLRKALAKIAGRGGRVQLILAGKSDVPLAQMAARSQYGRLLRAGIEIYEYQPQPLHAKLIRIDDIAYAGSLNLDTRSLRLNYELMARLSNAEAAVGAREVFRSALVNSRQVQLDEWRASQGFFARLRGKWAYFLLTRVDPFLAIGAARARH
jgi:cardiolipin synthase